MRLMRVIPVDRRTARFARHVAALAAGLLFLSACGGSGSGDSGNTVTADSLIIGGPGSTPASSLQADEIQAMAASRASNGLGGNLDSLQRLSDDARQSDTFGGVTQDVLPDEDAAMFGELNTSNSNFLASTLGVDDANARTTREGDVVTVDPDESRICRDDLPLAEGVNDDVLLCEQLMADLTVQIDAQSAETGIITYQFAQQPFLLIGYSPLGASYEVKLAGLQQVIDRSAELYGEEPVSGTLAGALRLSASLSNDQPGSEAGALSLTVTEAVSLLNDDSEASVSSLALQPSTVFEVVFDEATEAVTTRVDWGALQLIGNSVNDNGNPLSNEINLGGLSLSSTFSENSPALSISNVGIGNVPLTVTINSVESLSLSLSTFGLTLDEDSGAVTLDGALGAEFVLNNMMSLIEVAAPEFMATFRASAPAGTRLVSQDNGSTLVERGGPFSASLIASDNGQSTQLEVTANAGDCFTGQASDASDASDSTSIISPDGSIISPDGSIISPDGSITTSESESSSEAFTVVPCDQP